jgi:hypothetical protein
MGATSSRLPWSKKEFGQYTTRDFSCHCHARYAGGDGSKSGRTLTVASSGDDGRARWSWKDRHLEPSYGSQGVAFDATCADDR